MLSDEIISHWFINTVMDDKNQIKLHYYKTQAICQTYYLFSGLVKIFQVGILITQIDFILVFISIDTAISIYTTHRYLKSKTEEHTSLLDGCVRIP